MVAYRNHRLSLLAWLALCGLAPTLHAASNVACPNVELCVTACEAGKLTKCIDAAEFYHYSSPPNWQKAEVLYRKSCLRGKGEPYACWIISEEVGENLFSYVISHLERKGSRQDGGFLRMLYSKYLIVCEPTKSPVVIDEQPSPVSPGASPMDLAWSLFGASLNPGSCKPIIGSKYLDYRSAIKDFTNTCESGDSESCLNLGILYLKSFLPGGVIDLGINDEKVYAFAATSFRRACDGGTSRGCTKLGGLYWVGVSGIPEDQAKAEKLFREACREKDPMGCGWLGSLLEDQATTDEELKVAVEIMESSCERGFECGNAAYNYEAGMGVQKDLVKAADLYHKGCNVGDNFSCSGLSDLRESDCRSMSFPGCLNQEEP